MWHRAGTITVTKGSKTVTGAGGTAWVQNIRVGDGLQGPDGRLYEVTNVASDTALAIEPAYMGATASGQAYWIIPVLGYQKLLADRAAALVGAVGQLPSDVKSNTDAIGRNEDRIANAEQAMLTKIGNLLGLQNPKQSQLNLGVIQTLAGEVFNTDNCTVLENANGLSFRNPKGLQLSIAFRDSDNGNRVTTASAFGTVFYDGGAAALAWPQPFQKILHAAPIGGWDGGGQSIAWTGVRLVSKTNVHIHAFSGVSSGTSTRGALGIGLWK